MAFHDDDQHDPAHGRIRPINSIPLQDLSVSGASKSSLAASSGSGESHRRTLSERGRALFRSNRESLIGRGIATRQYTPLDEGSPSPPLNRPPHSPRAFITTPSGQHQVLGEDDGGFSPIVDRGGFQDAIGFAGLSYNGDNTPPNDTPSRPSRASRASLPILRTARSESEGSPKPIELDDGGAFFSPGAEPEDDDRLPLTNSSSTVPFPAFLAPFSANGEPSTPDGQRHDRHTRTRAGSSLSVRFSTSASSHGLSGSRLGDDLRDMEAGMPSSTSGLSRSPSSQRRSLAPYSTESPLIRAGTMMRKMSQRVVNLSNEPEPVEREIRRRSSVSQSQPQLHIQPPSTEHLDFGVDGGGSSRSPVSENTPSPIIDASEEEIPVDLPIIDRNPLRGKSLGIFPSDSPLRMRLMELLVHPFTEPLILLLIVVQTILLAVDSSKSVYTHPRAKTWGSPIDYALLVIFAVYTTEVIIKVIVSGFVINPVEYSTINRQIGIRQAVMDKLGGLFALHRKPSVRAGTGLTVAAQPASLMRSLTAQTFEDVPGGSHQAQRRRLAHRAFLRHSFNRLDFLAIVSFWISFILGLLGIEYEYHLWLFQMLSCLRILRLLNITSGTSVILRSLKRAAPNLLNVAFLIGFFWLLFAIVGVQSFKSSLRRQCIWNDNNTSPGYIPQPSYTQNFTGQFQFCGGWIAPNGSEMPWLNAGGQWGAGHHKGYLCPINSQCVEGENPYNGTVSFDNVLQSLELVFVIMTSNTFSDLLYYLTNSEYLAAALFFAFGIVIMTLWLLNLLIAVITSSFQIIREESKTSAFMAQAHDPGSDEKKNADQKEHSVRRVGSMRQWYDKSEWFWIVIIVYDLLVSALRSAGMHRSRAAFIDISELSVTMVLLGEILIRFAVDWRGFWFHRRNLFDLGLAIITAIIQIPAIHNSGQPYAWLTVFQILRIYRVVLAVTLTRDLIMLVLRHVSGILNLILFVFLLTFLAAIFAVQLFRGELPRIDDSTGNQIFITFETVYNAFLGMYQLFSSENWTNLLYNITRFDTQYKTAWIGAVFFILWFILSNFIVLNMFIAVIQENFDVSEDEKRMQQVRMFLQQKELGASSHGTLSLSTIFQFGQVRRQDPLDFGSAATEMLLKDVVVRDFLDENTDQDSDHGDDHANGGNVPQSATVQSRLTNLEGSAGVLSGWYRKIVSGLFNRQPNPFYSRLQLSKRMDQLHPRTLAREVFTATEQRKLTQREYLKKHPTYNVSLFLFKPNNPIRKFCQRIVGPGRGGDRMEGVRPSTPVWYAFSAFIYAAIVAMVLLACVTTPLYQREYFQKHPFSVNNWFVYSDIGFAALFTIEAFIKVIADGFFWTPNAYYRGSWGFIDGVVLVTLWINVITSIYDPGGGSRAIGAFKALRALRLLNVSDSARDTFHSVIVLGGWKVLSAAFVSLSLLVPFAIYGLNLFAGQMQRCNDYQSGSVFNLTDCVGEWDSTPYNWTVWAPRKADNSYYNFDNFGSSLFILFQIVSQEGWIDVLNSAESISGVFTNPSYGWLASQGNAVFFVIFNLMGAVFVLTLFVSVFMRNYTEQTGVAFLTAEQRSWLELRKLLRQVAPSKRPTANKIRAQWQEWCYRRAVTKAGRWQRAVTAALIIHLILLCLEFYPDNSGWEQIRDYIFLALTLFYIVHIFIRVVGLSWTRFRKSAWDIYSVFAVGGAFITTIMTISTNSNRDYVQLHKLFLVAVALMLIPRNNQLDQLFKTAAASFTAISTLLATWFVLFLVFAIAFTQALGLTRFNNNENSNINFRSVPKALILLFRMSVGEGWNQIMQDYASVVPPYCTVGERYFDGDCGSRFWAQALFITWNILSMYIFYNLFVSLIYESFSYVYTRSSGLSVISREEIRRFKQAWAEFDQNGTGYITKEQFPRFLGELSGVFEMRIYDGDFTVRNIMEDCRIKPNRATALPLDGQLDSTDIDLAKLNERLAILPVEEIRRRRTRMNTFYEEVLVSADPDRGIAFNALLMILAHYKVISDNKSLRLEEFLRRRARLQRVEEAVNRNIVVGFFDTLYWARRFRRTIDGKKSARMTELPQFGVPEIFIHDDGEDITSSHRPQMNIPSLSVTPVDFDPVETAESLNVGRMYGASGVEALDGSPQTVLRNRSDTIHRSPSNSPTRERSQTRHRPSPSASSIQADWHFAAAIEDAKPPSPASSHLGSDGGGARSRANSAVSAQDALDALHNSAWGESMRRSFKG